MFSSLTSPEPWLSVNFWVICWTYNSKTLPGYQINISMYFWRFWKFSSRFPNNSYNCGACLSRMVGFPSEAQKETDDAITINGDCGNPCMLLLSCYRLRMCILISWITEWSTVTVRGRIWLLSFLWLHLVKTHQCHKHDNELTIKHSLLFFITRWWNISTTTRLPVNK